MYSYQTMESPHKGSVGYVEFSHKAGGRVMILCEVTDIRFDQSRAAGVEVVPVASDQTCIWIDSIDLLELTAG